MTPHRDNKATPSRVSLREVAVAAGVSIATASMALRNDKRVSQQTKQKVMAVAAAQNYRPDPALSALAVYRRQFARTKQFDVLAYLLSEEFPSTSVEHDVFCGAAAAAKQQGFELQHFHLPYAQGTQERLDHTLFHRGIAGLILDPLHLPVHDLRFQWNRYSVVVTGLAAEGEAIFPTVMDDHFHNSCVLAQHLHELGYSRPGFALCKKLYAKTRDAWLGGFTLYQSWFVRGFPAIHLVDYNDPAYLIALDNWVTRTKIDVLIGGRAERFLAPLLERGRRIPDRLGLCGFHCSGEIVSGIRQKGRRIGEIAVETTISMLQRNHQGPVPEPPKIMIGGELQAGTTLRTRV